MHASGTRLAIELEVGDIVTPGARTGAASSSATSTLPPGADFTPLLEGLPGDRVRLPALGLRDRQGSIHLRYADGTEEVNRAGDLYYWPGGHTGWTDEGVTFVEFSPAEDLRPVLEHVGAQLALARLMRLRPGRRSLACARCGGRRADADALVAGTTGRRRSTPRPRASVDSAALEADGLDLVAEAAWWLGRLDDCIEARERAYRAYDELGDQRRAGQCAVWLWEHHAISARPADRAARGCDGPAAPSRATPSAWSYGALLLREAETAHGGGELDRGARARDARSIALGRRLRSTDLEAEALQTVGPGADRPGRRRRGHGRTSTRRCSSRSRAGSARTRPARCTAA